LGIQYLALQFKLLGILDVPFMNNYPPSPKKNQKKKVVHGVVKPVDVIGFYVLKLNGLMDNLKPRDRLMDPSLYH